jgi:hydroxyacylglutathione hydrolase
VTLEDHVGDIVRKARTSANVSAEAAAGAAGLEAAEYGALEETGRSAPKPDFQKLATLVGLHGQKLDQIAAGWLPRPADRARWRGLQQVSTSGNGMVVHCYLVWDASTREAALFDTGFDPQPAFDLIARHQLQLRHLFITHSHHDHVGGLEAVRARFPGIAIHTDMKGVPPQFRNRRDDCIRLGGLRITNRDTPGHAEDGVTYLVENWPGNAPAVAIVGDAIFAGSLGGARHLLDLAKQKVRDQILSLPADTLICPGHGPLTSVGEEREHNPFFI